jgi:phosphatidate cytidylyltransferase
MSELAKRVAVAAVGIPLVLGLVYLGEWFLAVPLAALAALAVLELCRLAESKGVRPFRWLGAPSAAALVLLANWQPTFRTMAPWALAGLGTLAAVAVVSSVFLRASEERPLAATAVTLFGAVYAGLALATVPLLHSLPVGRGWVSAGGSAWSGVLVLALPLAATWTGDSAAYFAGSAWGKRKLAPTISPNKSWVGFWAALFGAGAAAVAWLLVAGPKLPGLTLGPGAAAVVGVLLGLGAVVGDLAESLFKREAGVKDSGTFFPGHGGVLDRLDALFVTLPLAYGALVALGGGG